tara:strand:+ start:1049 stop:2455 length:1407 start_codon:yes stop_codon:yes gene_type:complete
MPFFSESQALGTGSSPWSVNGNDLYPDSTSYIVGIGNSNPDTALHITDSSNPQLKLDNGSQSYTFKAISNAVQVTTAFDFSSGTAISRMNGKEVFWASDTSGLISIGFDTDFTDLLFNMSGTVSFGYGSAQTGAKLHVKDSSNPQLLLDDGTSTCSFTYADNSSAGYLLANTRLRLDANDNHLMFFDTDGGSNDVGSVLTYSEVATNQSKLRFHMNGASFDGNYIELQGGSNTRIQINKQEGANTVDGFVGIGGSGTEFQLGTGTADSTKIYTGNSAVAEFTSTGKLILTEDTAGGATQLELKNGAGDTASFAQNSTNQSLDITTSDFDLNLYSTNASGNVSFCKADGTRVVRYFNTNARFLIQAGLAIDTIAVSAASTTIANSDPRIVYLCDTSSNAVTINLPAASDSSGRILYFKDKGGNAGTAARAITIDPNASETIDGAATLDINTDYGSVTIICDGSNWFALT